MADKIANIYRLKISLEGWHHVPINQLHRIIEAEGRTTFAQLHEAIFAAFNRYDPHMYAFKLTGHEADDFYAIDDDIIEVRYCYDEEDLDGENVRSAEQFTLDDAGLYEQFILHYLFDFGDDWMHRIRVEAVTQRDDLNPRRRKPYLKLLKSVGESPPQYLPEDWDEED